MAETLAGPHRHERIVQKSRFLALAAPVASVEAALACLAECRQTPATHHCWAYRLGDQYRSSDDGEPGGTAGRPILAAIDGAGIDRVVVVVTRWYGGIKLGAGGLVRAYGGVSAECLRQAPRAAIEVTDRLTLVLGHADEAPLMRLLPGFRARIHARDWRDDGVALQIDVPVEVGAALRTALAERLRGRLRWIETPERSGKS